MFKLSERKWDACFSPKENPLVRGNVEWWSELDIVNMGILKIKHVATVLLLAWWTVNAFDDSVSDDEQETYHLFTLDTHSVRSVSLQMGKKFFAAIKLSAAKKFFTWKTLQLGTASTTNTLAVEDLHCVQQGLISIV